MGNRPKSRPKRINAPKLARRAKQHLRRRTSSGNLVERHAAKIINVIYHSLYMMAPLNQIELLDAGDVKDIR